MRSSSSTLWRILTRRVSPIAIILYGSEEELDSALGQVESLLPSSLAPPRARTAAEAMDTRPSDIVLLVPDDETLAMDRLESERERNLERERPILVFLRRDGEAHRSLAYHPNLLSWVKSSIVDPEVLDTATDEDLAEMREEFQSETECTPEEWLVKHRQGLLPTSAFTARWTHRALFLEGT